MWAHMRKRNSDTGSVQQPTSGCPWLELCVQWKWREWSSSVESSHFSQEGKAITSKPKENTGLNSKELTLSSKKRWQWLDIAENISHTLYPIWILQDVQVDSNKETGGNGGVPPGPWEISAWPWKAMLRNIGNRFIWAEALAISDWKMKTTMVTR